MKTMHRQNKKINREKIKQQQKPHRNPRAETYDHSTWEFNRDFQKQTQPWRRKNQWTRREHIWKYPVKEAKIKEWKKPMGYMGHNQIKDMDMTRIPGKEKEKGKKCIFK